MKIKSNLLGATAITLASAFSASAEEKILLYLDPISSTQACIEEVLSEMFDIAREDLTRQRVYDRLSPSLSLEYDATLTSAGDMSKGAGAEVTLTDDGRVINMFYNGITWISTNIEGKSVLYASPRATDAATASLLELNRKLQECPALTS